MDSEFEQLTGDILADPLFQETRAFVHHGGENSVYDHSVATAHAALALAHRFGLSEEGIRSVTRAALLHDFLDMTGTATGSRAISASFRAGSGCAICMRSFTAISPQRGRRSVSA